MDWKHHGPDRISAVGKLGTYTIAFNAKDGLSRTYLRRPNEKAGFQPASEDGWLIEQSHPDWVNARETLVGKAEHYDEG